MKPASLSGRVTKRADGTAIAGAVVSIARAELVSQLLSANEPPLVAITDAQGTWTLTPVLPGTYFVAASAVGFLPSSRAKLVVESADDQKGIDLALDAGGLVVSGTVTDILGGPVADARVTVKRGDIPDLGGSPDYVAVTKTDGTYAMSVAPGNYDARATHDDYRSQSHSVEVAAEPVTVDFTLTPGGVIRGVVVARDSGKPVPGAFLIADGGSGRGGGGATARADDSGAFVMRGLSPGALQLKAQGPGYASSSPTVVELAIGEQVDGVRVLVDRAYSVYGNVVRKGKPTEGVPGVQLGLFSIGTQQFGFALEPTDAQGAFVIHGLRPASYMLFAGGENNVPEIGTSIAVVDKDLTGVVVEMEAGVTLTGRVDPPVAGARVSLTLAGSLNLLNMFQIAKAALIHAETDATGAFTVRNAPRGAFELVAHAPNGDSGKLPLLIGDVDQQGLVIKLSPRASISGRVVDDNGVAVSGERVRAKRTDGDEEHVKIDFNQLRGTGATTRKDGSFSIIGLEAGTYELTVEGMTMAGAKSEKSEETKVADGQQVTGVTLRVEARDGVIRGTVIGTDRRPVADAWVSAQGHEDRFGSSTPVVTGGDGRFTLEKLRRGSYTVVATGPKGASRGEVKDVKTGTTTTVTLAPLGTLAGTVTLDRAPLKQYEIDCDGPGSPDHESVDAADGSYQFEHLTPGSYTCTVTASAGSAKGTIDVPTGPAKLDLVVERWGILTGKVVDILTHDPVPDVLVLAEGQGAQMIADVIGGTAPKTDARGAFTLSQVAPGSGKLVVTSSTTLLGGEPLSTKSYTVTSGQTVDLGTIEIVAPRKTEAGTFGFGTSIDNDKLVVSSVKDDGPGAAAGVRQGDAITAINGTPVTTLTPTIAQQIVSSGTVGIGVTVQLTLDRAGTPASATVTSVKW